MTVAVALSENAMRPLTIPITATPVGVIAAGQTLEGHLYQNNGSNDDEDWVKIAMTQGTTYRFTYKTLHGGHVLPKITGIYDSGGTMVRGPVQGVLGLNNSVTIEYTALSAGNYYIGLDTTEFVGPTWPRDGNLKVLGADHPSYYGKGRGTATDWRLSLSN